MNFQSIYAHGFARVAACTTKTAIANPAANARAILHAVRACHDKGVALAVFPELCVSGYAIDDLLLQDTLLDSVEQAIAVLREASGDLLPLILVGAPLRQKSRIYNCAVAIHRGAVLGVVPKIHLPNYREFYERRHFASGDDSEDEEIVLSGRVVPFGSDLLFRAEDLTDFVVHVEICEDLWVPSPPSGEGALAGATVLANLSASNITVAKADTRKLLSQSQSARCLAAYLYTSSGAGESTTDLAWDGQTSIFENGLTLAETGRFPEADQIAIADVDLDLLRQERARQGTFDDNRRHRGIHPESFRTVSFRLDPPDRDIGFERRIERFPFVPSDPARLEQDCYEAYNIQVSGLQQRLEAIKTTRIVIGVSGGLDSTHALIVAAKAMDRLKLPRSNILGFTMPGFATGAETKGNAWALMRALGITAQELDIKPAAQQMLADLKHPFARGESAYDVTFENVQAGLRTDYLFRLANHNQAIVLGTGDLSELALGWCTYGVGDQMSHYNVNAGVPKTLIQHLIRWVVSSQTVRGPGQRDARSRSSGPKSLRSWCQSKPVRSRRAQRPRLAPTSCRTSICSIPYATGSSRRRLPSWPCVPGPTKRRARGRPASPKRSGTSTRCRKSGIGSPISSVASSGSASSSDPPCRTAPRWSPEAHFRRAAIGGRLPMATPRSGSRNWSATSRASKRDPEASNDCECGCLRPCLGSWVFC